MVIALYVYQKLHGFNTFWGCGGLLDSLSALPGSSVCEREIEVCFFLKIITL